MGTAEFVIWDTKYGTEASMNTYRTRRSADRVCDRLNDEHGSYRYYVRPLAA